MSVFISVGIVILAMLIMASLQLVPGIFALFYHYASGKYSEQAASRLALFYILGVEIIAAFLFIAAFYVSYILFINDLDPHNNILTWIFVGVLIALAFASFCLYYRHPHSKTSSELFIPRKFAISLDACARKAKSPSDAFALGALSNIPELVFTLPLYIITATEIMYMHTEYLADNFLTILYIVVSSIPLFIVYYSFRSGHTLADVMRSRNRDKTFHRLCLSFSYLTIAILIICFRIV
ncbi:hypothetical protein IKG60_01965 [Candidatus Saccharibacteria bacterium]|nr:hypothetical protein [Candidatus Saccharibacteria bacterium]